MRVIGLIGGLSWEASAEYYLIINEEMRRRMGALVSAKSLLYTINFEEMEVLQRTGRWDDAAAMMIDAAQRLEQGGADCLVICANTMHKVANQIEAAVSLPLLHIADATAEAVLKAGHTRVGLLGTRYTMEQDFIKDRLADAGLEVIVPNAPDRETVHRVIYEELCAGVIRDESRVSYQEVIERLDGQGATAAILGCTEIGLLIKPEDSPLPTFDTTLLHALAAVDFALATEALPAGMS